MPSFFTDLKICSFVGLPRHPLTKMFLYSCDIFLKKDFFRIPYVAKNHPNLSTFASEIYVRELLLKTYKSEPKCIKIYDNCFFLRRETGLYRSKLDHSKFVTYVTKRNFSRKWFSCFYVQILCGEISVPFVGLYVGYPKTNRLYIHEIWLLALSSDF